MTQRPKTVIGETVVVVLEIVSLEIDGRVGDSAAGFQNGIARILAGLPAAPAEPDAALLLQRRQHPDGEPAGDLARRGDGHAVGDGYQSTLHVSRTLCLFLCFDRRIFRKWPGRSTMARCPGPHNASSQERLRRMAPLTMPTML